MKFASKYRLLSKAQPSWRPTGDYYHRLLGPGACSGRRWGERELAEFRALNLQRAHFLETVLISKFFIKLSSHLFSNHPFESLCESETAVLAWAHETLLVTKGCTSQKLMCQGSTTKKHVSWVFLAARSLFLQSLWWWWPEFWCCLSSVPTVTF